ncbi:MAG TPA: hypothetical protein PL168_07190 [Methanobacterium sp.]|nr:hypothetical protein [Methanobacterium sp.]
MTKINSDLMGKLQKRLLDFQKDNKDVYNDLMNILKDKYCWKCPMRSTSSQSRCREIHAGRVLQEAVDEGIIAHLLEADIGIVEVESLINRMLKKKIKRQGGKQREKTIIIKVNGDQNPDLAPNTWLKIRINPKRVHTSDQILVSGKPLENPLLGSYALVAGFPFKIAHVKNTFHQDNFWYVEVENETTLPLESVFGVLIKVCEDD